MADPETAPSETDAYNAGYNQPNDPQLITAWAYDPPLAYGHQQDGTKPQDVDQQSQSGTQPQSVKQQPQSGTQPQNPYWQILMNGQKTPTYGQQPPKDRQQQQNYGQKPQIDEQQPPKYGQQPQTYGQQPQTKEQQPQPYGQQPQYNGLQQQVYGEEQPYIRQAPTIQQPMNIVANDFNSVRSDLLCPAFWVCLCCFWPTGIAAIIYASKAADAFNNGKIADGHRYYKISLILSGVSVVVTIIVICVTVFVR